jgi:hypothetical protein
MIDKCRSFVVRNQVIIGAESTEQCVAVGQGDTGAIHRSKEHDGRLRRLELLFFENRKVGYALFVSDGRSILCGACKYMGLSRGAGSDVEAAWDERQRYVDREQGCAFPLHFWDFLIDGMSRE